MTDRRCRYCSHGLSWVRGRRRCLNERCWRHGAAVDNADDLTAEPRAQVRDGWGNATAGHGGAAPGGWQGDQQPLSQSGQDVYQNGIQQHDADHQNSHQYRTSPPTDQQWNDYQTAYQQNEQYDDEQYGDQYDGGQQNEYRQDAHRQNYHGQDAHQSSYPPNGQHSHQPDADQQSTWQPGPQSTASVAVGSWADFAQTHSPTSTETFDNDGASMFGNVDEDRVLPFVEEQHAIGTGIRDDREVDEALYIFPEYPVVDTHYPHRLSFSDGSDPSADQSNVE